MEQRLKEKKKVISLPQMQKYALAIKDIVEEENGQYLSGDEVNELLEMAESKYVEYQRR